MILEMQVVILLLFSVMILLSMTGLCCSSRRENRIRESYTRKLMECLQPADRLPDLVFPGIERAFNRRLLIRLLTDLTVVLEGVEGQMLVLIFNENGLYRHILRECRRGSVYRKIMALSVFQDIFIPGYIEKELGLSRFLESGHRELRMVALLVWLNQDPPRMMQRLADWRYELSDRDCANIYALAERRCIPVSAAEQLLDSANPSVIRFGQKVLKRNGFKR
jgi:hypothetical protein